MKPAAVAARYAKALFEISSQNKSVERVFAQMRLVSDLLKKDSDVEGFLNAPTIPATEKEAVFKRALADATIDEDLKNLILVMAHRGRLSLFHTLVGAFQDQIDQSYGVVRGQVRSATVLGPEERKQVEQRVESFLNKKVIMNYKVESGLIGGLVAEVGSYTFDDSLNSHLHRLDEDLKRRSV